MKNINSNLNKTIKKILVLSAIFLLCGSILSGIVWGNNWANNDQSFYTKSPRINDNSRGPGYIIDLNITTGYPHQNLTIFGADTGDNAGSSVATGDVNGDGIEDIVIGAYGADGPLDSRPDCGEVYIIYGTTSLPTITNLTSQADVIIYGIENADLAGQSVATGDVNGDNKDDIIIGAPGAWGLNNGRMGGGEVYIIYGSVSLSSIINLNTSTPDVIIYGQEEWDFAGSPVVSGDVSSDSKDDIIISAIYAAGPNNARFECGEVYIINGSSSLPAVIDLNTTVGIGPDIITYGADFKFFSGDHAGSALATSDIDGNGKEDLVIGAPYACGPGNARSGCGEVYMIYGSNTLPSIIDLNTTTSPKHADLIIYGADGGFFFIPGDQAGFAVAAGDVSSDNKDDIIIGAPGAWGAGNVKDSSGEVYIINGSNSYPATIDLNTTPAAGGQGPDIIIYGDKNYDAIGCTVAVGEVSNDTKEDLLIGSYASSGPNENRLMGGEVYIINGSSSLSTIIDISTTTATPHHNVTIWGANATDYAGSSITTGDLNGDAIGDMIVGAFAADGFSNNKSNSGEVYVIYGSKVSKPNLNPWVTLTVPSNGTTGVALDAPIIVNFSEPMNQVGFTTSSFSSTPDPGGWSINWNLDGDGVNLTHSNDFTEKTVYQFKIITANDLTGKSLAPHPGLLIPNPFNFTTGDFTEPMITLTSPVNDTSNVNPKDNITVTFSEPMNHTTIQYTCQPNPGGWLTPVWDVTNSTVTFNHTNLFQEKRGYWFNITAGSDEYGLSLIENSNIPWHIYFTTGDFTRPKIVTTVPENGTLYVQLNADILVRFSEPMDDTNIEFECEPDPGGWLTPQWNATKDQVIFKHSIDFNKDTYYNFTITTSKDIAGNDLISGLKPNPWRFKTIGDNPIITATEPVNGTENVLLNKDIIVTFSKPMKTETVTYTCTPVPNGGFTVHWNDNNDIVTYKHATEFNKNTEYRFEITAGKDIDDYDLIMDIKNPLFFKTIGDNPIIIETIPKDGAIQVLLDADIIVKFSKPMNITTVEYKCDPTIAGGLTTEWNLDKTEVKYKHTTEFNKEILYTLGILTGAKDREGFDLIGGNIPNPWTFTTIGNNPIIISTYPAHDSTGIPLDADITVEFNKPMDTTTVTYTCDPEPVGGFNVAWNDIGDEAAFKHTTGFVKNTTYTFEITGGKDLDSYDLVQGNILNPWTFRTVGDEPVIFSTDPKDKEVDVELNRKMVITFSEPMNTGTVTFNCTPDPNLGEWTIEWDDDNKIVTYIHPIFFEKNTTYKFEITGGEDLEGYELIPGSVQNPWEFTTGTREESKLTVTLKSPANGDPVDTVTPALSWDECDDAVIYYVYLSTDKTNVESHDDGSLLITTQETSYTPSEKLAYDTTYYWTVIPSDGTDNGTSEVWSFTTPPEAKVSKDAGAEDWWLWIIIIIIVVIILIILAAVMLKRKKKVPSTPPEEEGEEAAPPSTPALPPQHPPGPPIAEEPEIATVDVEPKEEHEGVGGHQEDGTAETGVESTPTPPQPSIIPPLTPTVSQPAITQPPPTTQQSITQQPLTEDQASSKAQQPTPIVQAQSSSPESIAKPIEQPLKSE